MKMRRIAIGLRYDGANYHGWQYQEDTLPTVQLAVDRAVSSVADHVVHTVCAGRTDKLWICIHILKTKY